MRSAAPTLLLFACLLGAPLTAGAGEIYRYEEADGTIVYTNVPPRGSQARGKATRLSGSFQAAPPRQRAVSPRVSALDREELAVHVRRASRKYKIPEPLIWAVMHVESNFNVHAVSRVGASGLMQLMPATAEEMLVSDLFDVAQNIDGGTRYLRHLANLYDGDMVKMVAAYNAGPHAVNKYGGKVPPFAETQAYVPKVIGLYFQYKKKHEERLLAEEALASAED